MPNTFELIASSTVGSGGAATISFSSIPNTYTDLVLVMSLRANGSFGAGNISLYTNFNGTTTNRSFRTLYGAGSTANSYSGTTAGGSTVPGSLVTANTFNSYQAYIPNYNSSNNKSLSIDTVQENNSATDNELDLQASLWSNTAAITSIEVTAPGNLFVQYSTAYLYGVKNA